MELDWQDFTQKPDNRKREENKRFLIHGASQLVHAGTMSEVRMGIMVLFPAGNENRYRFLDALREAENRCAPDEHIGTVEFYENGLNIFCRRKGLAHAVGVWRWRSND